MQEPTSPLSIGERIRQYRRRRGMSQTVFAGLIGRSLSWVEKVEHGRLGVDRMSVVVELARVLRVSPQDLTGQPFMLDTPKQQPSIDEVRRVLMDGGVVGDGDLPPLKDLRAQITALSKLRQDTSYAELSEVAPEVICAARLATVSLDGDDRLAAFGLLTEVYEGISTLLKNLGFVDLAWIAATQARQAAAATQDALWEGVGAWRMAHVLLTAGSLPQAETVALDAAERLEPGLGRASAERRSVYGALHLAAAVAAARRGAPQSAWASMEEAATAARLLGGDRNDFQTVFGPSNVAVHRVAVAVELGEDHRALDHAAAVDPAALSSAERRGHHFIDVARAYGQRRSDPATVRALMLAERHSPERVHYHPMVRELLGELLRRERRRGNPDLRGLAERSGVLA